MSATDTDTKQPPTLDPSPQLSETPAQQDSGDQSSLLEKSKRKLLGLGKKKDNGSEKDKQGLNKRTMSPTSNPNLSASPPLSPPPERERGPSPRSSPRMYPVSPHRRGNRSSSPAMHSPASSQIFERNVQESVGELSPEIPQHIQIEDHIPPVLEASSLAITDNHLNPDEVQVIMHAAHQPAAAAVTGGMTDSVYSPSIDDMSGREVPLAPPEPEDSNPNYGSLDTGDVRRLSFISFHDVVAGEHVDTSRDPLHSMSLSTGARSPSPVLSPASSHGISSGATSEKGVPLSPTAAGGGELQIETLRQTLRKSGSGDLSGARSQPLSAVSLEDSAQDIPPFK
ncbi:hypothetical protein EJ04DRAFT_510325 [Polyplosphaeria fusca]|uniref:Uncharacterized protein n=1 Tax=Polyplosphaeria fusca TaxID=682080 RepID=A0A9P4V5P6_9PLEO|nr:hypothetical protein EJ04DRAFT_510325 [Polyplosphaeria fusca]